MPEGSVSLLQNMREHRKDAEVIFTKFTQDKNRYEGYAFCFYEGEDAKYYNQRVEKVFGDKYIAYIAGSKREVIRALGIIRREKMYSNLCTMFFIDRDYDESMKDYDSDLFETPCYSIENLYARQEVYERVLRSEFGLNVSDDDYGKCVGIYQNRLHEYNELIVKFNALLKYKHDLLPDARCSFSGIRMTCIAKITLDAVEKSRKYDETIESLHTKMNVNEVELEKIEQYLTQGKQLENVLRGKNQHDFFVELIKRLKEANETGEFFAQKMEHVRINITDNRLSELSQYASTPIELEVFLQRHFDQLKSYGRT